MENREVSFIREWLNTTTERELKDYIEAEEHSLSTNVFLMWLITQFEFLEKYEMCQIIKEEMEFRIKLFNDINSHNTTREEDE